MGRERDGFSGRYTPEFTDEDFLAAVEAIESGSTADIAEEVGCSPDLAYRRLRDLAEEGRVGSEKIAGNFRWFPTNED